MLIPSLPPPACRCWARKRQAPAQCFTKRRGLAANRARRNEAPHKITPFFFFFCYKTWFLYSKVKQSSYAKLALHKGEFNARLQSTDVSLMANCLSKLKRKEQMIRYKKVLKASTKGHFTNIISAALGLPAGLFRPGPAQL